MELPLPDYVLHFTVYAVLGALIYWAAGGGGRGWVMAALLGALYGATDEYHQSFVPGRDASIKDWTADVAGTTVLPIALYGLSSWLDRRRVLLGISAAGILTLIPIIVILRQSHPVFVTTLIEAALVAFPLSAFVYLRKRGIAITRIAILFSIAALIQSSMYAMNLSFQEMLHLYEYGFLGCLFLWNSPDRERITPTVLGAISYAGFVALMDESIQWIWPNRVGEIKDMLEDIFFAGCGAIAFLIIARYKRRGYSLRSTAAAVAVAAGFVIFISVVHVGSVITIGPVSFLTATWPGSRWPPHTVADKEALAHIHYRNELFESGQYSQAAAEDLILENFYGEFMEGHRYASGQRGMLTAPPVHYRSPVPRHLYFERATHKNP